MGNLNDFKQRYFPAVGTVWLGSYVAFQILYSGNLFLVVFFV